MEKIFDDIKLLLKDFELPHLARYVDDITSQIDKVHIAFIGEYNAGKSSLINTLLGKKIVAERDLPTTNRIVLVTHCPVEKREKINPSTELICINDPKLEHIVLVDTPGAASAVSEHEETLLGYLHKADLVVVVAPSTQPYSKEIEQLLELLAEKHTTQLAYVINIFEDPEVYEEDPDKIKRLKEFVKEKLRNILSAEDVDKTPIYAFSLRLVRKGDTEHPLLTQEWEDFKKFIFEEVAERAKKVKFAAIKEKLLKLFASEEILERKRQFEQLERELEKWQNLKEAVQDYAAKVKNDKVQKIEQSLDQLFEELKKDIEEILAKYGSFELVKNTDMVLKEIEETLRAKFFITEHLSRLQNLLDYRPEFVKLKKLYPELVVEPTIPARLGQLRDQLVKDIEQLPSTVGKPGKVAKWFLPLGALLAAIGVGFIFGSNMSLKIFGGFLAAFGGILFLASLYRIATLKRGLLNSFNERIQKLNSHYKKLYTSYYLEKFEEKLSKVNDYLDLNINKVKSKLKKLGDLFNRMEEIVYKVTFKL